MCYTFSSGYICLSCTLLLLHSGPLHSRPTSHRGLFILYCYIYITIYTQCAYVCIIHLIHVKPLVDHPGVPPISSHWTVYREARTCLQHRRGALWYSLRGWFQQLPPPLCSVPWTLELSYNMVLPDCLGFLTSGVHKSINTPIPTLPAYALGSPFIHDRRDVWVPCVPRPLPPLLPLFLLFAAAAPVGWAGGAINGFCGWGGGGRSSRHFL